MKRTWLIDTFLVFALVSLAITAARRYQPYGLAYIKTPSVPMGVYITKDFERNDGVRHGEVLCWRHGELGKFLDRGYLPPQFRLCKPVAGVAGDELRVTEEKVEVLIAGKSVVEGKVLHKDSRGRELPNALAGLSSVPQGSIVVLAGQYPNALDSRYLGPIPLQLIQKRMTPLWLTK